MRGSSHNLQRRGFTLVEIMIVVAIIGLLAAIAAPNYIRARKRTHAARIIEDLRLIEYALDRYAIENNKTAGDNADQTDLKVFFKTGSIIYTTGNNVLGHSYGNVWTVDSFPFVPASSFELLSDVAPRAFWSPYIQ